MTKHMAAFKPAWKKFFLEKAVPFFTKNLLLFAAFVLSLQIWWTIREQIEKNKKIETKQVDYTVKILYQKSEGVPMGTPTPEKVSVSLSGEQSDLKKLSSDLQLKLDTSQAEGRTETDNNIKYTWTVKDSDLKVPSKVQVENFKETKIEFTLDKIITKELKVEANLNKDELPAGYKIGNVTIVPEKVPAKGPASTLSELERIRTTVIPLDHQKDEFELNPELDEDKYPDIDFGVYSRKEKEKKKTLLVQIKVLRRNRTRFFKTLPVRILIPSASRKQVMACEIVSNPTVDLEVSGEENVINVLRREDIFIFANISEFQKPGLYQIDLRCAIDKNGISDSKITPSKVNVKLEQISRR